MLMKEREQMLGGVETDLKAENRRGTAMFSIEGLKSLGRAGVQS